MQWATEIFAEGLTSRNHRSPEIIACYRQAAEGLREKLKIPTDYTILFTSSATECWEILGQSFPEDSFVHIFNGAFGEKWATMNQKLGNKVRAVGYDCNSSLPHPAESADWVCLTHCETSNGSYIAASDLIDIKNNNPAQLLALDATSSLGGIQIPWEATDYVFASVQKCLGLPSGMAVLVCSPQAAERALQSGSKVHYNSLANSIPLARQYQTTHTPNILGIALLMKLMQHVAPIEQIERELRLRADWFYQWLEQNGFRLLIANTTVRSPTVITVQNTSDEIARLKKSAQLNGFVLGNGYGAWKDTTVRIANFPAVSDSDMMALREFLLTFRPSKPA